MEKRKKIGRIVAVIMIVLLFIVGLAAVYIRVNPVWHAAELKIEQGEKKYQLAEVVPEGMTLETRFTPPEGYDRVEAEDGSLAEYLREYPLLPDGTRLPVFDGSAIDSPYCAAVFDISVGDEGYQQCADSIIRLYSDYFYQKGQFDKITFQFSNGDECSYPRWRKGRRMLVLGDFSCEIPAALPDDSEQQYRNYLKEVMNYAGTLSLQKESAVISPDELRIGDFICNDTHVVMITDMAVNDKGEKVYLIGQSFIPAVCFHIITDLDGSEPTAWFTEDRLREEKFQIGAFSFEQKDIRRWKDGF